MIRVEVFGYNNTFLSNLCLFSKVMLISCAIILLYTPELVRFRGRLGRLDEVFLSKKKLQ